MSKMEGEGSSLIFQTTKAFSKVHVLHLNFQMQAHTFFLVEDFSRSCCIIESHRVFKKKQQQCNDLVIKVIHLKCEDFS